MDADPQVLDLEHSAICSLGWAPTLIEGALKKHLEQHFASPRTIQEPNLRTYLWYSQYDVSKISIESIGRWRPETAGFRPAIVLRRNDYKPQKVSIGDKVFGYGDGVASEYTEFGMGSHTLFIMAANYGEAESLGIEVYCELHKFGPASARELGLHRLAVVQMGRPQPVAEANGYFGLPVTVAYAHNSDWQVMQHAPIFRDIELQAFRP